MTQEQQLQNERERYGKLFMDYQALEHQFKWYAFTLGRTVQHTRELASALRSRVDEMADPEKKYNYDDYTLSSLNYMGALCDSIVTNFDALVQASIKAQEQIKKQE